jgi:hypothetical protein
LFIALAVADIAFDAAVDGATVVVVVVVAAVPDGVSVVVVFFSQAASMLAAASTARTVSFVVGVFIGVSWIRRSKSGGESDCPDAEALFDPRDASRAVG